MITLRILPHGRQIPCIVHRADGSVVAVQLPIGDDGLTFGFRWGDRILSYLWVVPDGP